MAKILVVVDNTLDDDIRVVKQINLLKQNGHQVMALCYATEKINNSASISTERIKVPQFVINILLPLEHRFKTLTIFWSRKIISAIKKYSPDFIIAHDLYMSKASRKAIVKTKSRAKLILDLHENYPHAILLYSWLKNKLKYWLSQPHLWQRKEKEYLDYADNIIVLSESFKQELVDSCNLQMERFIVFPNTPSDTIQPSKDLNKPEIFKSLHGKVMYYIGAIAERRGIFEAIESVMRLIDEKVEISFLIAGPIDKEDKERFHKYLNNPRFRDRIHYIPWISFEEQASYLNAADFCIAPFKVNPQHESGIANKIFQYMKGGKALIVSNCKPQANLINKYECGIVYDNYEELDSAIQELVINNKLRNTMGHNAYSGLKDFVTNNSFDKNFLELFGNT